MSDERAKTVMKLLVAMGIAQNRLISKGFRESKPLDTNETPEGKANNRRVKFVKILSVNSSDIKIYKLNSQVIIELK